MYVTGSRVRPTAAHQYPTARYERLGDLALRAHRRSHLGDFGISTVLSLASQVPAIGKLFAGSRRPESDYFDEYKKTAGTVPGTAYSPEFLAEAFIGLFRLKKNTYPGRQKYGPNDDRAFLSAMASEIVGALRAGKIGPSDTAHSIFAKVVEPWMSQMGSFGSGEWANYFRAITTDLIDAYVHDVPIVAVGVGKQPIPLEPKFSDVLRQMMPAQPAPVAPSQGAVTPVVSPPSFTAPPPPPPAMVSNPASPAVAPVLSNPSTAPAQVWSGVAPAGPAQLLPAPSGASATPAPAAATESSREWHKNPVVLLAGGLLAYAIWKKRGRR